MMIVKRTAILAGVLLLPMTASADHNSKWGEGWANMPNDIHNTRIDTRGDNTAFRDFVRNGNGADSVNRYATDPGRSPRQANQQSTASSARQSQQMMNRQSNRGGGSRRR